MEVLSFLDAVQRDMADNIYNFTKEGKCSGCGGCCSNLLPMSQMEVDAIHRYIRRHHIKECKHLLPVATPALDMTCPFRDNDNKICTIYEVRPEICKQFICDNEQRAKHNRKLLGQTRQIVDVRKEFFWMSIVRACKLCGRLQKKDEKQSNENWNVYDPKAKCECGGSFGYMDSKDAERLRNHD